jgi:hypothetical protein
MVIGRIAMKCGKEVDQAIADCQVGRFGTISPTR